jgi:hypothetical protein
MKKAKTETESGTTSLISDSFGNTKPRGTYEVAFRRWLVREIDAGRMTLGDAIDRFNLNPESARRLLPEWRARYSSQIALTLPVMTEKERQKLQALEKRLKQMEQQLENAQMKNTALETLIDVAEEKLKISIRKKSGPKQ